eukprot:jgi/Tetstr1/464970/TSEL_009703.t1
MASYVKVVLLATADSVGFASQLVATGTTTKLLRSLGGGGGLCVSTVPVDGKPVLTHWLDTVKACPRLLPLETKVFVVASEDNHGAVTAWAQDKAASGGFPVANVINTGTPGSAGCGAADGVAAYLAATGEPDATLVVVETDYLPEPEFAIGRMVEHAMLRAKDSVAFTTVNVDIPMVEARCPLTVEGSQTNPKVVSLDGQGVAGEGELMLAPLAVVRKDSVAELAAMAGGGLPPRAQLVEFCRSRVEGGVMYGLPFGMLFSVESLDTYLFTHSFFEWYRQQKQSLTAQPLRVEDSNIFLAEDTRLGGDLTAKLDRQLELLETVAKKSQMPWSSRMPIGPMIKTFLMVYERRQKEAVMRPEPALPDRFTRPGTWTYKTAKQEHPVYTTSNNIYGAKVPVQPQMPNSYHGLNGRFTNAFAGPYKAASLNVGKTRSKVHGELDEF